MRTSSCIPSVVRALMLSGSLLAAAAGASAQEAPASAAQASQAAQVTVPDTANITTEVYFARHAFKLDASSKARLDAWLKSTAGIRAAFILSIGHTDPGEAPDYLRALKLSEARAASVRAYLAGKGIEAGRVYVEGKADTQPVATNDTPAERARNRRVDVGMVGQRD